MDSYSVLAVLLFAITALAFGLWQGRHGRRPSAIALALAIAAFAAWVALENRPVLATILFLSAAAIAAVTSLFAPTHLTPSKATERLERVEWSLLIGVIVGAALLRFCELDRFPDFIHGEENVWTWQVATKLFSSADFWPIGWYFKGVPTSYFQEWPFFRLFGLNYISARYEVAFFGTFAVGLFYLLARTIVERRIALFSTVLLATSAVALASSRGAFVQSHTLFWTIAAYFLYAQALERRKPILFLLSGGALALGALTYQTFVTAIGVVGLHFTYEALRSIRQWRTTLVNLSLLASPVLLVWPRVAWYLHSQEDHVLSANGSLTEISGNPLEMPGTYVASAWDNFRLMLHTIFYRETFDDYLIIRPSGPIFLAGITALAVIGVAVMVPKARQRWPSFLLIWFFFQASFSPVVLAMPIVRAMLPAYPALFLFAGIGLFAALPDFQKKNTFPLRHASVTAAIALLSALALTSALAYFTETKDTSEGRQRQELSDIIDEYGGPDTFIVLPHLRDDPNVFVSERDSIRFMIAGKIGGFGNADDYYAVVPEEQLLTTLQSPQNSARRAAVVVQGGGAAEKIRADVSNALASCYSAPFWEEYGLMQVEIIEDRFSTRCDTNAVLEPISTQTGGSPALTTVSWAASPNSGPFFFEVQCKVDGVEQYEMEDFTLNNGWSGGARLAAEYSGSGYLYDEPNAGTATINLSVEQPGTYKLWLRANRRYADNTRHWLSLDGKMLGELAPPEAGRLNTWAWQAFGPTELQAGAHRLELSRKGKGDALLVDTLYISRDAAFDPTTDTAWPIVFKTVIEQAPESIQSFTLGQPLPAGHYRWRLTTVSPLVVNGLGDPLESAFSEFSIGP